MCADCSRQQPAYTPDRRVGGAVPPISFAVRPAFSVPTPAAWASNRPSAPTTSLDRHQLVTPFLIPHRCIEFSKLPLETSPAPPTNPPLSKVSQAVRHTADPSAVSDVTADDPRRMTKGTCTCRGGAAMDAPSESAW